jgi:hypothetical protein
MVNKITNLITDVGLQINTKKTQVMTNNVEIEIKLNGEALEYVPEYTYLGQLISLGTTRENKSKGGLEWPGTSSRAYGLYWPINTKNWRQNTVYSRI